MTHPEGLRPPQKLSAQHDVSRFDSGEPVLDDWLRCRALQNEGVARRVRMWFVWRSGSWATRTLAVGAVALAEAPGPVRRNMLDPLPVMVLGRLPS